MGLLRDFLVLAFGSRPHGIQFGRICRSLILAGIHEGGFLLFINLRQSLFKLGLKGLDLLGVAREQLLPGGVQFHLGISGRAYGFFWAAHRQLIPIAMGPVA